MPYEIAAREVRTPLLHCSRKVGAKTFHILVCDDVGSSQSNDEIVNGNFEMEADVTKVEKP